MPETSKAKMLLALHERDAPFIIPNPWDMGSAKILTSMGFEALATTSAGASFSMGLKDFELTEQQILSHCAQILSATDLPVSADLENGFGDSPKNAADTIEKAIALGLAGGSLEDFTGDGSAPIYDFNLAVERISAAAQVAQNSQDGFVLTARCENYLHGIFDLDDTIRRLQAFEAAGADVLYAPGLRSLDDIRTLCAEVSKPVNVVAGLPGTDFTMQQLADAGVKRISVGSSLARLAIGSAMTAAREMLEEGRFSAFKNAAGFAEIEAHF